MIKLEVRILEKSSLQEIILPTATLALIPQTDTLQNRPSCQDGRFLSCRISKTVGIYRDTFNNGFFKQPLSFFHGDIMTGAT